MRVEELSYGWIVRGGLLGSPGDNGDAVVIAQDPDERLYWCQRCRKNGCKHANAVLHHVMDQEASP